MKLHTKIQILENDIAKKDKILEEFIVQQSGQIARSGRMKPEVGGRVTCLVATNSSDYGSKATDKGAERIGQFKG